MYPIPLCDVLEYHLADKDQLHIHGNAIPGDPKENLLIKLLHKLREKRQIPLLSIHLLKAIPIGGGLGGGSADVSFFLRALNQSFSLGLSVSEMKAMVAKLGSDCPFFVENIAAIANGRGDTLENYSIDLKGFQLVMVFPGIHIPTAQAYAQVKPLNHYQDLSIVLQRPVSEWPYLLVNDFEPSVFKRHPILSDIKQLFYDKGASYAAMSGSGSSIFALFPKKGFENHELLGFPVWMADL